VCPVFQKSALEFTRRLSDGKKDNQGEKEQLGSSVRVQVRDVEHLAQDGTPGMDGRGVCHDRLGDGLGVCGEAE
jgi:hypothetical protein